ncbi:hypothetical protein KI387_033082, partial [Taxus chinensis]
VLHFDYNLYRSQNGSDIMSTTYLQLPQMRAKDWGPMPRWVAFVDFFLAARATRAIISGAHRRVATTYAQLIAAMAAANKLPPSFNALRNDLVKQIALRINKRLDNKEEDEVKIWLNERLIENKFALFLVDVWETSANSFLAELCVPLISSHHNSNIIIATSRSSSALLQVRVPAPSIIQVQELREEDS